MSTGDRSEEVATLADRAEMVWELPKLRKNQQVDLAAIRSPRERFYLAFVYLPSIFAFIAILALPFIDLKIFFATVGACLGFVLLAWIAWHLFLSVLHGNAIKVGPTQYPQLHVLIKRASTVLGIVPPSVFIMQGHGIFEAFVARRFSRRGLLMITSNLLDDLTEHRSSRELMFFVGRQLGLIATGYFNFWTFKHTFGQFSGLLYLAWKRRCHITADRLGLLVAGDLYAAEQALLIITAGSGVAPSTNLEAIREQRAELFSKTWAWIQLAISDYPYMVDRITQLREFAEAAATRGIRGDAPVGIGALPIHHRPIRAVPLMIVHGHDAAARLELENFLFKKFPHVKPVTMIEQADSARTLPEKFERMVSTVRGALAILTPDDLVQTARTQMTTPRARQNVIVELGWFWGRLGRGKCFLLVRGDVELPSDLAGVELHRFVSSPTECSEALRDFIGTFEMQ